MYEEINPLPTNNMRDRSNTLPKSSSPQKNIKHTPGILNSDDLYATVVRPNTSSQENVGKNEDKEVKKISYQKEELLPGWVERDDEYGMHYWEHIKTGRTQRDPPIREKEVKEPKKAVIKQPDFLDTEEFDTYMAMSRNQAKKSDGLNATTDTNSLRFKVRSLGWKEIIEIDLDPPRSNSSVEKCIVELSSDRNYTGGRYGDGKDLLMVLEDSALKLIDPENNVVLSSQNILKIRVWGVGHGNDKDFAYVARDPFSKVHLCNVFRCDTSARNITNALRIFCKVNQTMNNINHGQLVECSAVLSNIPSISFRSTKTKQVTNIEYYGKCAVTKQGGIEIIQEAINTMYLIGQFILTNVSVTFSIIQIISVEDNEVIVECPLKKLSFLGIGKDVKSSAFIISSSKIEAHVFRSSPSGGRLCKFIEDACKAAKEADIF